MFERYTEKARRVIFFARYEASQFGSAYIETEHLLFGVMREDKALMAKVGHGEEIDAEIRAALPVLEKIGISVDLPLSHAAKRVLAYGAEEAERLDQQEIHPYHLLLGLLRESGTLAEQVLRKHGITVEQLRAQKVDGNRPILAALRVKFEPMASRLTPDVEPAVTFSLRPDETK